MHIYLYNKYKIFLESFGHSHFRNIISVSDNYAVHYTSVGCRHRKIMQIKLENTSVAIKKKELSREIDNIGYTRRRKKKTQYVLDTTKRKQTQFT